GFGVHDRTDPAPEWRRIFRLKQGTNASSACFFCWLIPEELQDDRLCKNRPGSGIPLPVYRRAGRGGLSRPAGVELQVPLTPDTRLSAGAFEGFTASPNSRSRPRGSWASPSSISAIA